MEPEPPETIEKHKELNEIDRKRELDKVQKRKENADNIKVGKVNVDENQELAMKYNVMSIPTILVFKSGKISKTFVGVTAKQEIEEAI